MLVFTISAISASLCAVEIDLNIEFKFGCCEGGPFGGACPKIIVYMDHSTLKFLMLEEGLSYMSLNFRTMPKEEHVLQGDDRFTV